MNILKTLKERLIGKPKPNVQKPLFDDPVANERHEKAKAVNNEIRCSPNEKEWICPICGGSIKISVNIGREKRDKCIVGLSVSCSSGTCFTIMNDCKMPEPEIPKWWFNKTQKNSREV